MKVLFSHILVVLILAGCQQSKSPISKNEDSSFSDSYSEQSYTPSDYISWVESKEGFRVSKKVDNIEFQLQYMPSDYMVMKDFQDSLKTLTASKLKEMEISYEGLQYFKLKISIDNFHDEIIKYNIHNDMEYEDRVKYYSFNMRHRLKLIDGKDTLPCVMFNYERTFNLTPNSNFQLAFQASTGKSSKTLMIDDVYLGTGKIMMTITEATIKSTPKILF